MIKKFYSKSLIRNYFFARAVASDRNNRLSNNLKVWAYYNLGMYETVSNFPVTNLKSRGLLAKVVSHAACGEFNESKELLNSFLQQKNQKKYIVKLADALCPYLPNEALGLISNIKPEPLYSSILLKLGQKEKAFIELEKLYKNKIYRKKPEIILYYSNSKNDLTVSEKIRYLNIYLNLYNIPKIKLINKSDNLNVMNIECAHKEKYLNGPLVSILMTAYNIGERISSAINSILNQTYENIELIIVNDCSTDNTIEIIRNWEKKDSRIKVIDLKKNVGTYVAKNIALLKSKGEYITCHDSDDWSHPVKIERQILPLIENRNLVATISSWIRIDDFGNYYARPVHPIARINPSSLMFRKKIVLEKAGLWDSVRTGADSEFIARLKIVFGRLKVKRIKETLAFGAHRYDSLMTAKDTGYCEVGMSPHRLEYWESWNKWHIEELRNKKKPTLNISLKDRKFCVPEKIFVPYKDIKINLDDNDL